MDDVCSAVAFATGTEVCACCGLLGGGAGATLVFGLRSTVKSYKRTEVIVKSTKLYDPITIEITVKNSSPEQVSWGRDALRGTDTFAAV